MPYPCLTCIIPLLLYMYMAHSASSCSWWCSRHFWWLVFVFMCSGLTLFPLRKTTRPDREMSSSVTFLTSLDLTGGVEVWPEWAYIISIPLPPLPSPPFPLPTHTNTHPHRINPIVVLFLLMAFVFWIHRFFRTAVRFYRFECIPVYTIHKYYYRSMS